MGRNPCCPKQGMNRGAWTALEDKALLDYIEAHGQGKWSNIPKVAGLKRCGKSCRLRWLNYLRPGIKRGNISEDEEDLIIRLHRLLGNRWSLIAGRLPGRTDNEIKNYWNSNLAKKEPGQKRKRTKYLSELIKENDNKEKNVTLPKMPLVKTSMASPELPSLLPPPRVPEVEFINSNAFVNCKGSVTEYESSDVSSQSHSPEVVPEIDLSGILESDFSMFGDLDEAKGREGSMVEDWSGLGCFEDIEFLMSSEFGSMATQMNGLFNSL